MLTGQSNRRNLKCDCQYADCAVQMPLLWNKRLIQIIILRELTAMRKTKRRIFVDNAYANVEESQLFNKIFSSMDPMNELDQELNNKKSLLFDVSNEERINRLQNQMKSRLEDKVSSLQLKIRNGEDTSPIEGQLQQLVRIQRKLFKNSAYREEAFSWFGPLDLRVLVWSSKMALSEEALRVCSEFSFDKSLKLYYYYFKYYMSHLNLFYPHQIKIKQLFLTDQKFNFGFTRNTPPQDQSQKVGQAQTFIISIEDIHKYFESNGLLKANHFTGAQLINRNYSLGLSQDDEIFHALMVKLKIYLNENRNSVVKVVLYTHWAFGAFDIDLVEAGENIKGFPDIFQLPPDYAGTLQELIEIFFEPKATSDTHLAILSFIDRMLFFEETKGHKDFFMSLNENSSALQKLFESFISVLSPHQQAMTSSSTQNIPLQKVEQVPEQTVKNKEVLQKLIYLICKQIVEATEIHNLAEQLATLIFSKKVQIQVTDQTIEYCGQILITVEADEQELLNFTIEQIRQHKSQSLPYLKILNLFFSTKHLRQRRDLSSIARSISQSSVFSTLSPILQQQHKSTLFSVDSFTYATLLLVGNICSENPALVDTIAKQDRTIDKLVEFLCRIQKIDDYECINAINFVHYVCLKEGDVRNNMQKPRGYIEEFIKKLVMSNLYQFTSYSSFGALSSTLIKLITNLPSTARCLYFGLAEALKDINGAYKSLRLLEFTNNTASDSAQTTSTHKVNFLSEPVNRQMLEAQLNGVFSAASANLQAHLVLDIKLIIILRLIERCRESIFSRIRLEHLYTMYRRLIKLCFMRKYVLIDYPAEAKKLINLVHEIRVICEKKIRKKSIEGMIDHQIRQRQDQAHQRDQINEIMEPQRQVEHHHADEGVQQNVELIQEDLQRLAQQMEEEDLEKQPEISHIHSSNEDKELKQMGFSSPRELLEARVEGEEDKDKSKAQKQNKKKASLQSIEPVFMLENRKQKQLDYMQSQIKSICKIIKEATGLKSPPILQAPRKMHEILTTPMELTPALLKQLKLSYCLSRLDRLVCYLMKELLEQSCQQIQYMDILQPIQQILPILITVYSLSNFQLLQKNIPILQSLAEPRKYRHRTEDPSSHGRPEFYLQAKRIKEELKNKNKQRLVFYDGLLISIIKTVPMLVEKWSEKYIHKLLTVAIEGLSKFAVHVISNCNINPNSNGTAAELLDLLKIKIVVKMYLYLFCIVKSKMREYKIYSPFNHVFMYHLLMTPEPLSVPTSETSSSSLPMSPCQSSSGYHSVPHILTHILMVVKGSLSLDTQQHLPDTVENRFKIVKRLQIKCIKLWIMEFITNVFKLKLDVPEPSISSPIELQVNSDSPIVPPQQGQQSVTNRELVLSNTANNAFSATSEEIKKIMQSQMDKTVTNAFYTSILSAYKTFSWMRKSLSFHQSSHLVSLDNIRIELTSKFLVLPYLDQNIDIFLQSSPLQFSPLLTNLQPLWNNKLVDIIQLREGLKNICIDLKSWVQENQNKNITRKDTQLIHFVSENWTSVSESSEIEDKAEKIKINNKRQYDSLCEEIILISKRLFIDYRIAWHLPKKKNRLLQKKVQQRLNKFHKNPESAPTIREQVRHLANIVRTISIQLRFATVSLSEHSSTVDTQRFSANFFTQLIKFISEVIGNYETAEGEQKYKEEGDQLVKQTMEMLDECFAYREMLVEVMKKLKKSKTRLIRKIKNKGEVKKTKTQRKRLKRNEEKQMINASMSQHIQQELFERDFNGLRRNRSQTNLNQYDRPETPRPHYKRSSKSSIQPSSPKLKPAKSRYISSSNKFSLAVQGLLINILAASEDIPYLKNETLHLVTDLILNQMPKSQQKQLMFPKRKCIELDMKQILPYLLRTRICSSFHQGYWHKLTTIATCLITEKEEAVNLECAIKRIFYQENSKQIPIRDWMARTKKMKEIQNINFDSLSYLLQIKKSKSKGVKSKSALKDQSAEKHNDLNLLTQGQGLKKSILAQLLRSVQPQIQTSPRLKPIARPQSSPQNLGSLNSPQSAQKLPHLSKLLEPLIKLSKQKEFEYVTFNEENVEKYSTKKGVWIVLAPGIQMNTISYQDKQKVAEEDSTNMFAALKKKNRKKLSLHHYHSFSGFSGFKDIKEKDRDRIQSRSSCNLGEQEIQPTAIKAIQFIPNKNLKLFINQIINSIVRLLVSNLEQVEDKNDLASTLITMTDQNQSNQSNDNKSIKFDVFNINILIECLTILIKEYPCLSPFITKFKCRKIVIANLEAASKRVKQTLTNLLSLDNRKEITLLSLLIRAVCPLTVGANFNIVFNMCLDSTVFQKQKIPSYERHQKEKQQQMQAEQSSSHMTPAKQAVQPPPEQNSSPQSIVTFGHVVRQKALLEIQECLFGISPYNNKDKQKDKQKEKEKEQTFLRRLSVINLMTKLFSIKQFCKLCIETHGFVKNLEKMYIETLANLKQKKLNFMSIIAKKYLIPFFTNTLSILLEVNISLQLQKKEKVKPPKILLRLHHSSISGQLVPVQFFHPTKFKANWPYTTITEIRANSMDMGFDFGEVDSSDDDESSNGGESGSSGSELDEEQLEQFLNQVDRGNVQQQYEPSEEEEQRWRNTIEMGEDEDDNIDRYDYTNSWINYDTVNDELLGIEEEEQDGDHSGSEIDDGGSEQGGDEIDNVDENEDQDGDDDGNSEGISIYPHGDDQIIEHEDDNDEQEGDAENYDEQDEYEQGNGSAIDQEHIDPEQQSVHLSVNSRSAGTDGPQIMESSSISLSSDEKQQAQEQQQYENLKRDHKLQSLYRYFNYVNQIKWNDQRNYIIKVQNEQDLFIKELLAVFDRDYKHKLIDGSGTTKSDEMDRKLKKINIEINLIIEEHSEVFLHLIDNFNMLLYVEHIEYFCYSAYEFEFNLPPMSPGEYSDTDSILQPEQFVIDSLQQRRLGTLRNQGFNRNLNQGQTAARRRPELAQGRARRNGILINDPLQIQNIGQLGNIIRSQEQAQPGRDVTRINLTRDQNGIFRATIVDMDSPQQQNREQTRIRRPRGMISSQEPILEQEENQLRQGEGQGRLGNQQVNADMLEGFSVSDPSNMMNMEGENQYGMNTTQLNEALQSQGFSLETFLELPSDLQSDIIANIRQQQLGLSQQARNNPEIPNFVSGNETPIRHFPNPNTPVLEPVNNNTPVLELGNQGINLNQGQSSQQHSDVPAQHSPPEYMDQYKKLSSHHLKKINKDIIYLLNRDGKNNHKFFESYDEFIEGIFELIYILNQNDFINFPFNLLACMCINSSNQTRILTNIQAILLHGPYYQQIDSSFPYTCFTNNLSQVISSQSYPSHGFTAISLKLLYLLLNLSKSYSLSISMLYPQSKTTAKMNTKSIEDLLSTKTVMQNLLLLLKYEQIKDNLINLEYLLGIIKNITNIKYNWHVHHMINSAKDKDKDKEKEKHKGKQKVEENNQEKEQQKVQEKQQQHKMQNQSQKNKQKLIGKEQKQKIDRSKQASLQLTQQNNALLFSLLQSDFLKQNAQDISKIIMRLSLDEKNLNSFIHFFKKIIRSLAQKITKSLVQSYQKYSGSQTISHRLSYKDKLYKSYSEPIIVRLMLIFYEIIKSMKKSITTQDRNANLLDQFRRILECEEIKQLCQKGCEIIEKNPSSSQIMSKIHEFIDCFFAIFNILGEKQDKETEKQETKGTKVHDNNPVISKKSSVKRKFTTTFVDLENLFEKKLCTPQGKAFINANIRNKLSSALKGSRRSKESLFEYPIILVALETPHMLQFDNKKSLFKVEIKRLRQKKSYGTVYIVVERSDVFQQSYNQIISRKPEELKGKLKIQFDGEEGEDVGGLTRQWFQLLSKEMFNENYALFIKSSTGSTYQPYSKSYVNSEHLSYFKFIGRVMGKALHDGYMLDAYFTPAFYKHLLGLPVKFQDMEQQDFEYYKSLKWILQNSPQGMDLNFTYEFDNFGQLKTENLVPNGNMITVTDQNKIQYVQLISNAKMAKSVEKQYENLLQGFHEFIPPKLIKIFDEKQLEIMISGLPTIDIEDLRRNTDLVSYSKNDQIIIWLFEVLEEFDMSLRTAFLQFITGTSRVPSEGFKGLRGYNGLQKFNIHKYYDVKHLPRSHTCFNQLDLPPYESKQILIQKLTLAITEGKQGFGML